MQAGVHLKDMYLCFGGSHRRKMSTEQNCSVIGYRFRSDRHTRYIRYTNTYEETNRAACNGDPFIKVTGGGSLCKDN